MTNPILFEEKEAGSGRKISVIKNTIRQLFTPLTFHTLAGAFFETIGSESKAMKHYIQASLLAPDNSHLHFKIGHLQYKNGLIKEAASSFRKAVISTPDLGTVHWVNSIAKAESGQDTDSFGDKDLETGDNRNPETNTKSEMLIINNNDAQITDNPVSVKFLSVKGISYYHQGLIKEAGACFRQVLELDAKNDEALLNLGLCLCAEHKYNEALSLFGKAAQIRPNNPAVFINMGLCHNNLGRYQEALNCYTRAEDLGLITVELLNNKGFSLVEMGHYNEALICYSLALELNPGDLTLASNKGTCLYKTGRHMEALECFDQALQTYPTDITLLNNKGLCLEAVGRYSDALAVYRQAMELEPDNSLLLINIGSCLGNLDKFAESLDYFDKVIELEPFNREVWSYKALVLEKMGQNSEAVHCYNKALGLQ